MHYLPRNGSNSREISRTLKNSQKAVLQIQEIKKEAQNQETKPTIRSEMQRQVRIYSLFWILTDELEEQWGCRSLKTKRLKFLEREANGSNVQTRRMFRQMDKGCFYNVRKSEPSLWDACNHKRLMSDMSDQYGGIKCFINFGLIKAKNVRIEGTADGTGRISFLIGRTIRKIGGQMFTQIFTPMTWHNSSGLCTRGAATCTTWLLDVHAARIVHLDSRSA